MMLRPPNPKPAPADAPGGAPRPGAGRGFTIIEMMAVVVIMAIIAGVSLPAIQGLSHSHVVTSAAQQMEDDLNMARRMAISHHTTVYVLFVPPNIYNVTLATPGLGDANALHQLVGKSYTSYAIYEDRSVGSQPGQNTPRYLTEWKSLPEGVLIAPSKFTATYTQGNLDLLQPFLSKPYAAFPLASSASFGPLPCVAFDSTGALYNPQTGTVTGQDQVIALDRGSIFYPTDANGNLLNLPPDVSQPVTANAAAAYVRVRINWLNGRSRIETPPIQ